MDSKDVHNQQSGSPSQSGQGNPSNATQQPGGQNREQQPGQQDPTGAEEGRSGHREERRKSENRNGKALSSRNFHPHGGGDKTAAIVVVGHIRRLDS